MQNRNPKEMFEIQYESWEEEYQNYKKVKDLSYIHAGIFSALVDSVFDEVMKTISAFFELSLEERKKQVDKIIEVNSCIVNLTKDITTYNNLSQLENASFKNILH